MSPSKKILFEYKYFTFFLVLIIGFNILLLFLPLTNVFGYEFSALNSLLLSFLCGIYTIIILKKLEKGKIEKSQFIKTLVIPFTAFLFFPAVISIIHMFFSIDCSLCDGVKFYFVITIPSVLIGSSLGFFANVIGKRFAILKFMLLYILILLIPLLEFYFNPQIFFYNPLFGYYPGTIYDEGLSVDIKLLIYRLLNIIFFYFLFRFSYKIYFQLSKISKRTFLIYTFFISIFFVFLSPKFGYSTNFNRMTNYLNEEIETPHFIIHYSEGLDENLMKAIALHHEYYYGQISHYFQS